MFTYPHLGERIFPFALFALEHSDPKALHHGVIVFSFIVNTVPKFREYIPFKVLRL